MENFSYDIVHNIKGDLAVKKKNQWMHITEYNNWFHVIEKKT